MIDLKKYSQYAHELYHHEGKAHQVNGLFFFFYVYVQVR